MKVLCDGFGKLICMKQCTVLWIWLTTDNLLAVESSVMYLGNKGNLSEAETSVIGVETAESFVMDLGN
jgi:hypothetical protein